MGVQFAGNILVQSNGGPLPISSGGTGQITAPTAINALLPSQAGQGGRLLSTDGVNVTWQAAVMSPGGADTNIQYNDAGSFGGSSNFVINKSTGALTSLSTFSGTGLLVSNAAATTRALKFQTAGSDRWLLQANNVNETGSDVGSNFEFVRVADNGATSNQVFTVARLSGIVDFKTTPTVNGVAIGTGTGTVTSVAGTGTVSGLTLSGTVTSSGSLTLGGTLSLTSGQVTTALGFTPYDAANPSGYISGITSGDVTTALGFTPYNATNPSGYTTNVGTVTSVAALTLGTSGTDLSSSVATGTVTPVITLNVPTASSTTRGVLSAADWTTFSNKSNTSGTVTSVSVVTANGVSGSVATSTVTPAITLTLGAITPASVAATGTVSGSNLSGTNTGDQTITLTGDVTGSGTGSFATTLATVNASPQTDAFRKVTVNGKGLTTATSAVTSSDITTSLGYTPVNKAGDTMTGALTATGFTGPLTGNASTATTLQTARAINGVSFDGSAPITVTAAAGTLTGTTLNATVVASSLQSVGTLLNLTVTNPIAGSVTGSSASTTGNAATVTNGVYTTDTGTVTNTMLAGSIANAKLLNSSTTIGTTAIALGASSTTLAGLTSVTSTSFTGALTGNASTVTNGVYTTDTGTVTNTMLAGSIANAKLLNSSLTLGSTSMALGSTTTTVAGLASVTSTSFTGALTGNASTATTLATARNISASGDATWTVSFNGSADATAALTLTTVNASPQTDTFRKHTINAKGLTTATSAVVAGDITTALGYTPVNKAGDTMTGLLILSGDPTAALGAVTKQYADSIASGVTVHTACETSTTAASNLGAATYNNGASGVGATLTSTTNIVLPTIGGYAGLTANSRLLVKDQATQTQNGVYVVTSLGSAGVSPWVLTRAADFDGTPTTEIVAGDLLYIQEGTLGGTQWVQTTLGSGHNTNPAYDYVVIGTDNIVFGQFTGAGTYTGGTGITVAGTVISNTGVLSNVAGSGISVSGATGNVTVTNTGVLSITGTANQVIASASTGAITLSLPQSINSGAAPTFTGTNFSGTAASLSIGGNAATATTAGTVTTAAQPAITSVGTLTSLAMSGAITLNNATYLQAKNTTGTAGRIAGINASNALYIGDIDNVGNGTINVTVSGVQPLTISSTGIAVTGTVTGTSFNSITGLSSTTPAALGTAAVGTGTTAARADHVHQSPTTITGNAGTATSIAGGAATQVPFQSAASTTAFSADLVFDDTAKTLTVGTAATAGYPVIIGGQSNSIYQAAGATNSLILRSLAGNHMRFYTDYGTGSTRGGDFRFQAGGSDTGTGGNIQFSPGQSTSGVSGAIRMIGSVEYLMNGYGTLTAGSWPVDFSLSGMYVDFVLGGNITFTFLNPVQSNWGEYTFRCGANPSAYTITWPAAVSWATGAAPLISTTGSTTIKLISTDGGVTYLGSVVGNSTVTNDTTTNATYYPTLATVTAGPSIVKVSSTKLSFNPSTGVLSSTTFSGAHSGSGAGLTSIPNSALTNSSVTVGTTAIALGASSTTLAGLTSVTSTSFVGALTGNASTATSAATLTTARNINGVSFNGSADITVTAAAGTLTGTVLNSTVVTSALSTVGVISSGTWSASFGAVSGANLTSLTGANVTGTVANATTAVNATNTAITDDVATATSVYPTWASAATGNLPQKVSSTKLSFVPSTGVLTSTSFTGAGTGLTGTAASLSIGGNAATATTAGTVTTAAQPAITSVGTLTGLTVGSTSSTGILQTGSIGAGASMGIAVTNTSTTGYAHIALGSNSTVKTLRTSPAGNLELVNTANTAVIAFFDNIGNFTAAGNVTAYSDERLKTNWRDLPVDFTAKLAEVKVGIYDRTDAKITQVGVSAQSLQTVMPDAVLEDDAGMLSVAYGNAALAACIALAKEVQALKAEIAALKAR
jgi:hypothetical protein